MNIINNVLRVIEKMRKVKNVEVGEILIKEPISRQELLKIEEKLEFEFPQILKEFYLNDASELQFKWYADLSVFGSCCKFGGLNIMNPNTIIENHLDMKCEVQEILENQEELEDNEGLQAIVEDWTHWIPLIRFANGDAFCIDKRSKTNQIVFFEHEVIEGEVNLHGLKIALNFEELIKKWSKVGFVDIYDWYEGVNEDGIDLDKEVFKSILKKLMKLEDN